MTAFVDPRDGPIPPGPMRRRRTTAEPDELVELHRLCREGRVYDVEHWIQAGRPLQVAEGALPSRRRRISAMEIALERQDHALVLVLLCNGYDPNLEDGSPLDLALRARRWDLLDLLLDWGADPRDVDLDDLFGTYRSDLFERFRGLGVDMTKDHAFAWCLAEHTTNKPLFGYARRLRQRDPNIQAELNSALAHHADRGNEKGVALCLWAGADPHAPARSLRFARGDDEKEEEDGDERNESRFIGFSAIYQACSSGHAEILERLGPDPNIDAFDDLFAWARRGPVIKVLSCYALPHNVGPIIHRQLWTTVSPFDDWFSMDALETLFRVGARWKSGTQEEIAAVRHSLLQTRDDAFVDVMKLLAAGDNCAPDVLKELGRTPAMRRRMTKVGFIPAAQGDRREYYDRPTRSREVLAKFGVELPKAPKPAVPLPKVVEIGMQGPDHRHARIDRTTLFERVWAVPVVTLAEEWGLSDRGLSKACRRLRIPVPPRGYWAKLEAGKRVRRPSLPSLQSGEAEEIIIWVR